MVGGENNYIYVLQLNLIIHTEIQVLLHESHANIAWACRCEWWVRLRGCWAAGTTTQLGSTKGRRWDRLVSCVRPALFIFERKQQGEQTKLARIEPAKVKLQKL